MADPAVREAISRQARAWLAANALILDTETTGLGDDAEVVELAVIDCAGAVLLDTLVRPSGPVPAEAAAIHGITDAMLAGAPTWSEIHARFCDLVEGRQVLLNRGGGNPHQHFADLDPIGVDRGFEVVHRRIMAGRIEHFIQRPLAIALGQKRLVDRVITIEIAGHMLPRGIVVHHE